MSFNLKTNPIRPLKWWHKYFQAHFDIEQKLHNCYILYYIRNSDVLHCFCAKYMIIRELPLASCRGDVQDCAEFVLASYMCRIVQNGKDCFLRNEKFEDLVDLTFQQIHARAIDK